MKKFVKKFFEKLTEGILFLSSTVTTLAIVLMVIFLFREGYGLFGKSPVEEGSVIVISKNNPVQNLKGSDIKKIFDQEVTNWKSLGGKDDSIILFRFNDISKYYTDSMLGASFELIPQRLNELIVANPGIIAFFPKRYLYNPFAGKLIDVGTISVGSFFSGEEWYPTAQPAAQFGILPLILGTLWVSFGAILIALPLGLATAIYLAEIASKRIRNILKPVIELLAGIPSVVFGFFGLIIIVPLIQQLFDLPVGETGLAGSIILGIMALPTVITISEDALRTTPKAMKEASLALGANRWQTIARVVIPYSISGIAAAAILGIGRAMGETMAVLMVTGNAAVIPHTLLAPVRTIPATIAAELGEAAQGGLHYKSLFALGCVLFVITLITNLLVEFVARRRKGARQ